MSSFKRRTAVKPIMGTRPSPSNAAPLLSTGLTSIDDLLGGGLPLSTSLLIESDTPTSYAELLLKYWVAQGLECRQDVLVVASGLDGGPGGIVESLMEVDGGRPAETSGLSQADAAEDEEEKRQEEALKEQMKIAFRYEGMKQHQTTVDSRGAPLSLCRSTTLPDTCFHQVTALSTTAPTAPCST
jgi:elongator complex protein 4